MLLFTLAASSRAQSLLTAAELPDAPTPQSSSASQQSQSTSSQDPTDQRAEAEREIRQQESQRMLGIVPAFNEVIGGHAVPLTPGQKFRLFFRGSVDPYQFAIVSIDAGIEQAQNEYPEYHQGTVGYLRRYGAAFADNWDGNFWGNAVLPSLLHQDPRYFRLGHGRPMHRILYAAATTVIAKNDSGRWQPNYSNIAGNLIGGAISNLYYPASERGIGLTISRGLTVSAEGAFGALAEEFYPDYARWLQNRHARKAEARAAAAAQSTASTQQ